MEIAIEISYLGQQGSEEAQQRQLLDRDALQIEKHVRVNDAGARERVAEQRDGAARKRSELRRHLLDLKNRRTRLQLSKKNKKKKKNIYIYIYIYIYIHIYIYIYIYSARERVAQQRDGAARERSELRRHLLDL